GFVRWTEQRNFEAVLDMMAEGRLDVRPLISHRFTLEKANEAYDLITSTEQSLGILFDYPTVAERSDSELCVNQFHLSGSGNEVLRDSQKASVGF
ncbi:hypothetical protein G9F45_23990, partial [Escherichia coli]|uniref:hypothetical protein n=1 Tax=Escherichia coli TaxID=562 RepID=UPI0013EE4176